MIDARTGRFVATALVTLLAAGGRDLRASAPTPVPSRPALEDDVAAQAADWIAAALPPLDAPMGCVAGAGTPCWDVAGAAVLRVSARVVRGRHRLSCRVRCVEPIAGTVMLDADAATYRIPHGPFAACPLDDAVELPDEVGHVRERRRARVLAPDNRDELEAALLACSGTRVRVRRLRRRLAPAGDGETLSGSGVLRLRIDGHPAVRVRATSRFVGAMAGTPLPAAPTPQDEGLQACRAASLRVRCRAR